MSSKHMRHASLLAYLFWSSPALLSVIGVMMKAKFGASAQASNIAELLQYLAFLAPLCFVALVAMFVMAPPRGMVQKVLALLVALPTAYYAWQALLMGLYYAGFGGLPNV